MIVTCLAFPHWITPISLFHLQINLFPDYLSPPDSPTCFLGPSPANPLVIASSQPAQWYSKPPGVMASKQFHWVELQPLIPGKSPLHPPKLTSANICDHQPPGDSHLWRSFSYISSLVAITLTGSLTLSTKNYLLFYLLYDLLPPYILTSQYFVEILFFWNTLT